MTDYLNSLLTNKKCDYSQKSSDIIEEWGHGILKINSNREFSPIILSCGVHGNETAPIEILNDILKSLISGELTPKRDLLLIFGHIEAMKIHKRFIDFNMNRLFDGTWKNYPEAMESPRAQELEKAVDRFLKLDATRQAWHLDLHTAIRPSHYQRFAVFPKQENSTPLEKELHLLGNFGIDAILLANGKASTFSAHSNSHYNCLSYTLELGKVYPFGQNPHEKFQRAKEGLIHFIQSDDVIKSSDQEPLLFRVVKELIKDHEEYNLNLADDYANFTPIQEGHALENLKDNQKFILSEEMAVVFPNNEVPVGQRTGLLVKKINK